MERLQARIGELGAELANARKSLVLNLSLLGETSEFRDDPDRRDPMNWLSAGFNDALASELGSLRSNNPDIMIQEVHVDELFADVMNDPGAFGLTNVTDPPFHADIGEIVSNPEEYLFSDTVHPTATGHQLLANQIVPESGSVVLIVIGSLLLAVMVRRRSR